MHTYRRIRHAAHYMYQPGKGHDLDEWDLVDNGTRSPVRPADVPANAEYHSGYVRDGVQHWVFVRRAPLSPGTCDRCR